LLNVVDAAEALYLALISDPSPVGELTCSKAKALWMNENFQESIATLADKVKLHESLDLKHRAELCLRCSYASTVEAFDEGLNLLTSSQWLDMTDELLKTRERLSLLFDVDLSIISPPSQSTKKTKNAESEPKDELESYSALVREAGY
jgi:hypothetical protein